MRPLLFVLALTACGEGMDAASDGGVASDGAPGGAVDLGSAPSTALGANVEAGGVAFRLWAPHATGARVTGSFAGSPATMTASAGGLFEAHVAGAEAGDHYAFSLDQAEGDTLVRTDPYCRQLADDGCVIVDPSAYAWQTPTFVRPSRERSVVYELHVGSFAVDASLSARQRAMLGAVMLLTAPGVPMIFMGEESLATQGFGGTPAALQAPTADGLLVRKLYRDLIRLRRNLDGTSGGLADREVEVFHRNDAGKALAYRRHGASGQDVLVLLNLKNKAYTEYDIGVDDPGPWTIRVNTTHSRYGSGLPDGQTGTVTAHAGEKDGKPYALPLQLGAYGAIVLSK